jgi:hypothetical protein
MTLLLLRLASRKGDSPLFSNAMKKRGLSLFLIGEDV